jgi:hypothetical protein
MADITCWSLLEEAKVIAKPASTAVTQDVRPKIQQTARVRTSRTQNDAGNYQHRKVNDDINLLDIDTMTEYV